MKQSKTSSHLRYFHLPTILLLSGIFLLTNTINAQTRPKLKDQNNSFLTSKSYSLSDLQSGVIYWCSGALAKGKLFTDFKPHTGLSDDDVMVEVKTTVDAIPAQEESPAPNYFHTLYQQYYKGVPVEGNTYTEHHDGEFVFLTSGFVIEGLEMNVVPAISEADALNFAITHIDLQNGDNPTTWIWDSIPTAYPEGQIVIIYVTNGDNIEEAAADYKLAYKFPIRVLNSGYYKDIYIDAENGNILKEYSKSFADGSFNHLYYGTRSDLDQRYQNRVWPLNDRWFLNANDASRNIYTTDEPEWTGFGKASTYDDYMWDYNDMPYSAGDNNWGNDHWSATAAHYCAQKAWDFFRETYNRNGTTGWGQHIRILADHQHPLKGTMFEHDDQTHVDYFWIDRLDGSHYAATYDIIAHEFTHGVVYHSSPLPNEKASGAINESFADIFGLMAERRMYGVVNNWTIGEDALVIRDMQSPHSIGFQNTGQPEYYQEFGYWSNIFGCVPNINNDFCFVHANAGVQNKWFYLLSMGGSLNVNGQTRSVIGIGIDKAARIAYYTMVNMQNYDQKNETFNVVRANSLAAAATLYGYNSSEYYRVCQAWYAVNVGNCTPLADNVPCLFTPNTRANNSIKSGLIENANTTVKISLFPNPGSNVIILNIEEPNKPLNSDYKINIFDLQGKNVFSDGYKNIVNQEINIADLISGTYIVNITSGNWNKNIRFVKQ